MEELFHAITHVLYIYPYATVRINSFQPHFCVHRDPDSVSFCLLATDDFECDVALQIHFTLIQAFCFDNDISIVRVNDLKRLNALVGAKGQLEDAHCVLITVCIEVNILLSLANAETICVHSQRFGVMLNCILLSSQQNPAEDSWEDPALEKLHLFCEESRSYNEWVPEITLPER